MDRKDKTFLKSIIKNEKMPCSHCSLTKTCSIYANLTPAMRQSARLSAIASWSRPGECLALRWQSYITKDRKGLDYDVCIK